jgi:hypothetical protein
MLGSLNPLVQRVRNGRWWTTTVLYVGGAVIGGMLAGTISGAMGATLRTITGEPNGKVAIAILAASGVFGALIDLGPLRLRLPTTLRQVDETWRYHYRNWVYAAGYGFQLGLGIMTIVTTASVYATLGAAFLTGSWQLGGLLGAWFGLARSLSIFSVARVKSSEQLSAVERAVERWNHPSKAATAMGQALLGIGLVAVLVT